MATDQAITNASVVHLPITGKRNGHYGVVVGHALVLDDDFTRQELGPWRWHFAGNGYIQRAVSACDRRVYVALHRLIFGHYHGPVPPEMEVDHIDRNILNNLPGNLRAASRSLQKANRRMLRTNTTGYVGVSLSRQLHSPWKAAISARSRQIYLGYFPTAREAADAVNVAYAKYHPDAPIPNPLN